MKTTPPVIEFDSSFVEEAVFLVMSGKSAKDPVVKNFHREREEIYQSGQKETQNGPFSVLYKNYFVSSGINKLFEDVAGEYALLRRPGLLIFIKRVWSKKQEDAELYIQDGLKTVFIALMAGRVLTPDSLKSFLRHELWRVSDMLDPDFQYSPDISLNGKNELEDNLIRDRFRALWDMYITARIIRKGNEPLKPAEAQRQEFKKNFFFFSENEQQSIISDLNERSGLKHVDLLGWAQDERSIKLLGQGGLRCPLCDFSCYAPVKDWSAETSLVIKEIEKEHPGWNPSQGICPQCLDLYHSRV
jgi:hypothetical protein